MLKGYAGIVGAALVLLFVGQANAQCTGDCNGDGTVAINEVITCVNIGLELLPLEQCDACDANGDGAVTINEIITSVNIGLGLLPCGGTPEPTNTPGPGGTPTNTPQEGLICGDGVVEADEQCDDGNNFGGDGCASNCTNETRREGTLTENSGSVAKSQFLPFVLPLRGTTALTTGLPRDVTVIGNDGTVVTLPGQVPVVTKAEDVRFDPVSLTGLTCVCVRGIPLPELFGPGNSGKGLLGCSPEGLMDVDFLVEKDHNTTPGDPGNSGPENGLPDDPDCTATFDFGFGVVTSACLEGTGEACSEPNFEHVGVCNSPTTITRSGGPGGRGSLFLLNNTALALLADRGACGEDAMLPDGSCQFADYGPDCLPCTDDDLEQGIPNTSPLSSGTGKVIIYDSNNQAGVPLEQGTCIDGVCALTGGECASDADCIEGLTGELSDCDALIEGSDDGLEGRAITAFPGIDGDQIGDTVTITIIESR